MRGFVVARRAHRVQNWLPCGKGACLNAKQKSLSVAQQQVRLTSTRSGDILFQQGTPMDFEKLLKLGTDHMASYVEAFGRTFAGSWPTVQSSNAAETFNAELWVFLFLSVLIGSSLATVSTGRKRQDIHIIVVYVVANWLAYSAFVFVLSRFAFGSTVGFLSIARVTLYSLGVAYVVASFFSLLVSIFTADRFGTRAKWAKYCYIVAHALLLIFLLYVNYQPLNQFSGWQSVVFSILAPIPSILINLVLAGGVVFYSELADFDLRK